SSGDETKSSRAALDAREVLARFLAKVATTRKSERRDATLLDEAVRTAGLARDLLLRSGNDDDERDLQGARAFADVARSVRAASESLAPAAAGAEFTVL